MTRRFNFSTKPTPPALWLLSLAVRVVVLVPCVVALAVERLADLPKRSELTRALELACLNEEHDNPTGDCHEYLMASYLAMALEDAEMRAVARTWEDVR